MLVLDEPNSSLDRLGEIALMKTLAAAKKRRITVFIITQREMVLGVADKILRLKDGVILDYGPRDAVIKKVKSEAAQAQEAKERKEEREKAKAADNTPLSEAGVMALVEIRLKHQKRIDNTRGHECG